MPSNRPSRTDADFESSLEGSQPVAKSADLTVFAAHADRLGRYRIVCELATGGMASVTLAIADGLEKLLALKIIHPHLARDPGFVAMFMDEARIASGVAHRNVCSVFDHGEHGGNYYMAMEYLAGQTLREVVRRARAGRSVRRAQAHMTLAYVIAQACEGLHAAHELRGVQGDPLQIVHRDVSPQNLFVTYDGHVSVIDFGIASAAERCEHTAAGVLKGKFSYMAPEQLRQGQVDRRADIWALGVCLWEALARRRLFARSSQAETLMSVLSGEIQPPSELDASVPAVLDAIVLRALARDVDARYPSARALGLDLLQACRSAGCAVGPLELEALMGELFPDEIERAAQLEQQAKQIAAQERAAPLELREQSIVTYVPARASSTTLHSVAQAAVMQSCAPSCAPSDLHAAALALHSAKVPQVRARRAGLALSAIAWASAAVVLIALLSWAHAHDLRNASKFVARAVRLGAGVQPSAPPSAAAGQGAKQALALAPQQRHQPQGAAPPALRPEHVVPQRVRRARTVTSREPAEALARAAAPTEAVPAPTEQASQNAAEQPAALERAAPAGSELPANAEAAPASLERSNPLAAGISFAGVRTAGSLIPSVVARMLSRASPLVRSCYLDAASHAPADIPASVPIWFTIDDSGNVREGGLGAQARSSLAYCVMQALRHVHSDQRPDVGVVKVAAELRFQPPLSPSAPR